MKQDFKNKILKSIKKSGFTTELKVSKILNKRNWLTLNNYIYLDKDKNVNREIDFFCIRNAQNNSLSKLRLKLYLTIEVKKSDKYPWVFFVTKNEPTTLEHGLFSLTAFKNINLDIADNLFNEYPRQKSKYVSTSHTEAFRESEVSNIYKAIESTTKATYYFHSINELTKRRKGTLDEDFANDLVVQIDGKLPSQLSIFIPLVVFEGTLCNAILNKNSEMDIKETKYVPYESYYIDDEGVEHFYAVDIIHLDYLNNYLLEIEKWLDKLGVRILSLRTKN